MLRSPTDNVKASSHPDLTRSEMFVAVRKRKANPAEDDISELKSMMLDLMNKMKEDQDKKFDVITSAINEVKLQNKSILEIQEKLEKICDQSTAINRETKKLLTQMSAEHNEAILKINLLEEQLEEVQRHQRGKCLQINNIPFVETENLQTIVEKLHSSVGIDFKTERINSVHRNKLLKNKAVIVEYQSQYQRNEVLKAVKSFNKKNINNKLNANNLGFMNKREPVYINELLTPKAKQIFFHARTQVKNGVFMFCWINNGKIFVKKSETDTAIYIKSISQIEQLGGITNASS